MNLITKLLSLLPQVTAVKTATSNVHVRWSSVLVVLGIIGYFTLSSEWHKIAELNAQIADLNTKNAVQKIDDKEKKTEADASKNQKAADAIDKQINDLRKTKSTNKKLSDKDIEAYWKAH